MLDQTQEPRLVVFSGGTGGNSMVSAIQALSKKVSYVMPISDNGGSTSEILRVLGGIGVGDLRSRLIRLIPDKESNTELFAIKTLLSHRLATDRAAARSEWLDIVEGLSGLWQNISNEKGQVIRSFLRVFSSELMKRARPTSTFNFSTGSIGNFFLTGMRLFFGSIETAIFMFASFTGIDPETHVFPIINTSHMTPIAAQLLDGTIIAGQNAISHPSAFSALAPPQHAHGPIDEDANLPGSLAALRNAEIMYDKNTDQELPSPIEEIYYINPYGQRMAPAPNARVLDAIQTCDAIIYAPGSLYTSLIPLLIPPDLGALIRASPKPKIMFLNGSLDRETPGYDAMRVLRSVMKASGATAVRQVCTHLVYLRGPGTPHVDERALSRESIKGVCVPGEAVLGTTTRAG